MRLVSLALLWALIMPLPAHAAAVVGEAYDPDIFPPVVINKTELEHYSLALALYYEDASSGGNEEGLRRIARVIIRRAWDNVSVWGGASITDVIFHVRKGVCQFSFACSKRWKHPPNNPYWEIAKQIAKDELSNRNIFHDHARYYLNPKVAPRRNVCRFKREFVFDGPAGKHDFFRPPADREERLRLAKSKPPECVVVKKAKKKKHFAKKRKHGRHASR